jgi:hypothetical protein
MAKLGELTPQQEAGWRAWVEERPECIRAIARRLRPDTLYRLKTTGQRGIIYSFSEDGTVTMNFPGEFNPMQFSGRQVFGLNPDDIEECDDLRTGIESLEPQRPAR